MSKFLRKNKLLFISAGVITGIIAGSAFLIFGQKIYRKVSRKINISIPNVLPSPRPVNISNKKFHMSFESIQEIEMFETKSGANASQSREHATDGRHSVQVRYSAGSGFPGFQWEVFGNNASNWKGQDSFSFDVYNESDHKVSLQVKIKSGRNYPKKTFERSFSIPSEEQKTFQISLSSLGKSIDPSAVSYLNFFLDRPDDGAVLYFDNLRVDDGQSVAESAAPAQSIENNQVTLTKVAEKKKRKKENSGEITLRVNPHKVLRKINPLIYGSNLAAKMEFEKDVADFAKEIGITYFRFPGGGSDGYRWQSGTFDFSDRADEAPLSKIKNLLEYCRIAGTKLVLQVNLESGTSEEAALWVDYMNKQSGFRVDYWELGNEIYGSWDKAHMSGEEYAEKVKEYSQAMKAVDPTIKIGADFGGVKYQEFDEAVMKNAADYFDFISFHWFPNHINPDKPYKGRKHPLPEEIMANSLAVPEITNRFHRMIEKHAPHRNGKIEIAFLEWDGSWDAVSSDLNYSYQGIMWSLSNAIFYADTLGQFALNGVNLSSQFNFQEDMFGMIRGWDKQAGWGGSRWDHETVRPKALAFKLFARYFGDQLVDSQLQGSPKYHKDEDWRADSYTGDVPYVTAYASKFSDQDKLTVVLINKHSGQDFNVRVILDDANPEFSGKVWILNGPDLTSQNDGNPGQVYIQEFEMKKVKSNFIYKVMAHSVNLLEISLSQENP